MLTLQLTPLPPPEKKTLPFLTGDRPCAYLVADPLPPPLKLEALGFPQVLHSKTEGQWITKATVQWPW